VETKTADFNVDCENENKTAQRKDIQKYYDSKTPLWYLNDKTKNNYLETQLKGIDLILLDDDFKFKIIQQKFDSHLPINIHLEWLINWDNGNISKGWIIKDNQLQDYVHFIYYNYGYVLKFKWNEFTQFVKENEKTIKDISYRTKKNYKKDKNTVFYSLLTIEWMEQNYKGYFKIDKYDVNGNV